ncbi:uncharacterized protein BXZ73DRAFT_80095 [Epithele typhae]|uniref:uncharacterized protein n=1 Tax=Epithele typhae TaxID=378194 RepID=UPI00200806F2|nr:uncharacterized protein BXZ73DRAFT_80095 [Epithele typhae]KAH9920514.1 hypothetical protein BXZ73DRAFT_80095 [Epithele typhae]
MSGYDHLPKGATLNAGVVLLTKPRMDQSKDPHMGLRRLMSDSFHIKRLLIDRALKRGRNRARSDVANLATRVSSLTLAPDSEDADTKEVLYSRTPRSFATPTGTTYEPPRTLSTQGLRNVTAGSTRRPRQVFRSGTMASPEMVAKDIQIRTDGNTPRSTISTRITDASNSYPEAMPSSAGVTANEAWDYNRMLLDTSSDITYASITGFLLMIEGNATGSFKLKLWSESGGQFMQPPLYPGKISIPGIQSDPLPKGIVKILKEKGWKVRSDVSFGDGAALVLAVPSNWEEGTTGALEAQDMNSDGVADRPYTVFLDGLVWFALAKSSEAYADKWQGSVGLALRDHEGPQSGRFWESIQLKSRGPTSIGYGKSLYLCLPPPTLASERIPRAQSQAFMFMGEWGRGIGTIAGMSDHVECLVSEDRGGEVYDDSDEGMDDDDGDGDGDDDDDDNDEGWGHGKWRVLVEKIVVRKPPGGDGAEVVVQLEHFDGEAVRPIEMLLDTGAATSHLPTDVFHKLHLALGGERIDWSDDASMSGSSAGGGSSTGRASVDGGEDQASSSESDADKVTYRLGKSPQRRQIPNYIFEFYFRGGPVDGQLVKVDVNPKWFLYNPTDPNMESFIFSTPIEFHDDSLEHCGLLGTGFFQTTLVGLFEGVGSDIKPSVVFSPLKADNHTLPESVLNAIR